MAHRKGIELGGGMGFCGYSFVIGLLIPFTEGLLSTNPDDPAEHLD